MIVLISGMEMPKHDDEYVIFTVYGDGGVVYGPLNRPHVRYKNRAVPVPEPHGRLIDADAVFDNLERTGWYDNADRDIAEDLVLDAPTVIPASEEGE